jgi:hypothetical protein
MPCLVLILLGVSPRLGVAAIWLLSDWVDRAFVGPVLPILGIIFLPWTTALYIVGFIAGGAASPWGIIGIAIGLFLDIAVHAGSATMVRR